MRTISSFYFSLSELPAELSEYLNDLFGFPTFEAEEKIKSRFSLLKQNLGVYVEYPYVDKLYRNTYYNFFSTKHRGYDRDCVRMTFFEEGFDYKKLFSYEQTDTQACLGYICIRPFFPCMFGRGIISPNAFKINNFMACSLEEEISVKGSRFKIRGFPFASQDNEYMVCAETAIWEMVNYFGNKYSEYRSIYPSEIIDILSDYTHERDVPSHGLYPDQISYVLKSLNFGVRLYHSSNYPSDKAIEFLNILQCYVDSAIPVVGILKSQSDNDRIHAILFIGYKEERSYQPPKVKNDSKKLIYQFGDFINEYVICDDNKLIYQLANFGSFSGGKTEKYSNYYTEEHSKNYMLESIIVPLPDKIYLEAAAAQKYIKTKIQTDGGILTEEIVLRVFFTTSKSFKNWILGIDIDIRIKTIVIETAMPKFVYIGEISNFALLNKAVPQGHGLIIVDTTQLAVDSSSLLFMWTSKVLCYYDKKNSFTIENQHNISNTFPIYQNLNK